MKWFYKLNLLTKLTLAVGAGLLIYSLICRFVPIYFFWESMLIGWVLILIGCLGFLFHKVKKDKETSKYIALYKCTIGGIILLMLVQGGFWIVLSRTNAYKASVEYIKDNEKLKSELGKIRSVVLLPIGSIEVSSSSKGDTGNASLSFIVNGEYANKDMTIYSYTDLENEDWVVYEFSWKEIIN